jgi:hypothetical protein
LFVLVAGNIVDSSGSGGTPALSGGGERTEIVSAKPTETTQFLFGSTVKGVETDPEPARVSVLDQSSEAMLIFGRPIASLILSPALDHLPGIVPPPPIIRCWSRLESFGK